MVASESRHISQARAILEATDAEMARDPSVIMLGEGVPDPKGVFETTTGLLEKYGTARVFDTPLSENAMTGICIGASLSGLRPILVHQRIDFALLSMDQIVNNAAKWHYMFGSQSTVPMVIRMIVGRGWGQGPQHSQSLQSLFGHIPGLKVVMPVFPFDAKGLLISAIQDPNPVIYIEHRWLHSIKAHVPEEQYLVALDQAEIVRTGADVTIVAMSYMVPEALKCATTLQTIGIDAEVIDLRSIAPIDTETVFGSVRKTGRLVVADTSHSMFSVSSEIVALVTERQMSDLKAAPKRVSCPPYPSPSSPFLADTYYPDAAKIAAVSLECFGHDFGERGDQLINSLVRAEPRDVPDLAYSGPF